VENAGNEVAAANNKEVAAAQGNSTPSDPQVVGPYFMGSVDKPTQETPKKPDESDDNVIDVLNYQGPKK